jgi:hypothetical protein
VVAGELLPLDVADTAAPGGGAPASLPPIFHFLSHMNFRFQRLQSPFFLLLRLVQFSIKMRDQKSIK